MLTFTISGIGYLITAVSSAFFSYRLHQSYNREKNPLSLYYGRAFLFLCFTTLSYALPTFFWPEDGLRLALGEFLGNIFLVFGFAYFIMIPLTIRGGVVDARRGYYLVLVWGLLLLFLTIKYFPKLYIDENTVLTKVYDPALKIGYYLFIGIISLIVSLTFFEKAGKSSGYSKIRSTLLGFAFLFGGVGGGFIKVVEDKTFLALSFTSLVIGFLFIFFAAMYRKRAIAEGEVNDIHNNIVE